MTNASDQLAAVQHAIAGLYRQMEPTFSGDPVLGKAAKAAGLSTGQVRAFLDGEWDPPPHQGVILVNAILDQRAASRASLQALISTPRHPPVPSETTREGALAEAAKLSKEFAPWAVTVDGLKTFEDGAVKLVWRAHRPDDLWPDVSGANAVELHEKLTRVEEHRTYAAEQEQRYLDGRGAKLIRSRR